MHGLTLADSEYRSIDVVNQLVHNTSSHFASLRVNNSLVTDEAIVKKQSVRGKQRGYGRRPARRARVTAECLVEASNFDIAVLR